MNVVSGLPSFVVIEGCGSMAGRANFDVEDESAELRVPQLSSEKLSDSTQLEARFDGVNVTEDWNGRSTQG